MNAEVKRIADGLAAGKIFYLRGGKKLKGKKAEAGSEKLAPADVPPGIPPSGDIPPSTKPPKEAGKRDK